MKIGKNRPINRPLTWDFAVWRFAGFVFLFFGGLGQKCRQCLPLLYSTLLYFTLLYSTLLYFTLLYSTLLYSTLLYFTLLYFTLLYFTLDVVGGTPGGRALHGLFSKVACDMPPTGGCWEVTRELLGIMLGYSQEILVII